MSSTSDSNALPRDCTRIQDELVAYLYGELEGPSRDGVEDHLGDCRACTELLASYRETLLSLNEWKLQTPLRPERPRAELARIRRGAASIEAYETPGAGRRQAREGSARRARLVRLSARLTAIAAAALVTLSLLGAEITTGQGQLTLRLSMPVGDSAPATVSSPSPTLPEHQVRRIAADEFRDRTTHLERRFQQFQSSWTREHETERERFALVVDRSQEEQRRAILALENLYTQISHRQEQLDQRTRDALVELTEAVLVLSE